ncbi:MAG: tetratricopeptide repeat protein [Thermodesulfobacteriota bacterium]|nr:tetratricopeptide repeat protein [Thermodesulfobacteriota bacterium]
MSYKLKAQSKEAQSPKQRSSKQMISRLKPKSLLLSALSFKLFASYFLLPAFSFQLLASCVLLSAFSFELSASCCPAWAEAEAPKLTPAVQKAVYTAQQAMEKKDYLKAEECLKKFIKKNPKKPHYLVEFTLANALAAAGKDRDALPHYRAAANLYPAFTAAWQNMGKIYFDLKQYNKAGDCLLKAYELNEKTEHSLLYYAAVSYIMAKKERKALLHLEYLVSGEIGPPKTEWLEALLKVYMDLKLKEKAFAVVRRLIDENGDDPRWWKILAQLHLQQSDYKPAVAALTVHSYLTSPKKQDIMLLGDLYNAVGVPLSAAVYYEKALTSGNNPAVYKKLASAYIGAHRPAKAIEVLDRALEKKPTSGHWFMMGQALYEEENFDKAYNAFNQSACLNSKNGRAYLMMGYCALQMDKKEAARTAFQKASRFPKQRKMAKELLKQVASLSKGSR